ncbi:uncharacterized protein LOC134219388 [Armigeres subalbatus]|uniref:uncharacterized protein LOC134219388 n=1 Tax=Armigeres subalbatus TaxID=124917 RepID=UPI002ED2F9CC
MASRRSQCVVVMATTAVALFAANLIDRGTALQCQFCIGVDHCNVSVEGINPTNCTDEIVRKTNTSLATFMPTLVYEPKIEEDAYQCVHVRATSLTDMTFLFIRGCIYSMNATDFCDLRYASFRGTRECVVCDDEDVCNDVAISDAMQRATPTVVVWLVTLCATLIIANHYLRR